MNYEFNDWCRFTPDQVFISGFIMAGGFSMPGAFETFDVAAILPQFAPGLNWDDNAVPGLKIPFSEYYDY